MGNQNSVIYNLRLYWKLILWMCNLIRKLLFFIVWSSHMRKLKLIWLLILMFSEKIMRPSDSIPESEFLRKKLCLSSKRLNKVRNPDPKSWPELGVRTSAFGYVPDSKHSSSCWTRASLHNTDDYGSCATQNRMMG